MSRASIFDSGDDEDIDVAGFAPKADPKKEGPPKEQVRAVSEATGFPSRQPPPPKPRREPRRYRTGRNVQLNVKASQETIDEFYRLSDQQGWVLGETLERALEALRKQLGI